MPSRTTQKPRGVSSRAKELGRRIQAAREQRRLTQAKLAAELGVTDNAVTQWETGRAVPRAERLEKIASSLGVMVTWLLTGEGPSMPVLADSLTELQVINLLRAIPPEKQAAAIEAVARILISFS